MQLNTAAAGPYPREVPPSEPQTHTVLLCGVLGVSNSELQASKACARSLEPSASSRKFPKSIASLSGDWDPLPHPRPVWPNLAAMHPTWIKQSCPVMYRVSYLRLPIPAPCLPSALHSALPKPTSTPHPVACLAPSYLTSASCPDPPHTYILLQPISHSISCLDPTRLPPGT